MNEKHSAAIVFLLAAILCVLLFGSSVVLTAVAWATGIFVALAVIGIAVGVAALIFKGIGKNLVPFLKGWVSWIGSPILVPLNEWRQIRDRRSRGERVGMLWVIPDLLLLMWCLLVGVVFALMAGVPVVMLLAWAGESFKPP